MSTLRRNPGPSWGFAFIRITDRLLPAPVIDFLAGAGAWIALAIMPEQRGWSREYLRAALGREPRLVDQWRQFNAFTQSLFAKLRVADDCAHRCVLDDNAAAFETLAQSPQQALFGTLHLGNSDVLGYMLSHYRRRVSMVRLRVGNSDDTTRLGRQFEKWVSFIWVNEPSQLLFALKEAVQSGGSLAMQCDRPEFSARLAPCHFLGARRLFPLTIYYLAILFELPVVHVIGLPEARDATRVFASTVFTPQPGAAREAELARARDHFEAWLARVEAVLKERPFLWSNFTPLNPEAPAASS